MTVWSKGGLAGFDGTKVELCGRILGQRNGQWYFHDGVRARWFPKEHCVYRRVGNGGYGILTVPQWLAKKATRWHTPKRPRNNGVVARMIRRERKDRLDAETTPPVYTDEGAG
jgi:hypothetical protein